MNETTCKIFDPSIICDAWCVTTNCTVGKSGLVMGAGTALAAKTLYPILPGEWGRAVERLHKPAVIVTYLTHLPYAVVAFPTKIDWRDRSYLPLIASSAHQLVRAANEEGWNRVMLPRPGCTNGRLDWKTEVRPVIDAILDDRFTVFSAKV